MDPEVEWLKKRCGKISASEVSKLALGVRGGVTKGVTDYISKKRYERKRGYPLLEKNRMFEIGKKYEPEAIEWLKENFPELDIRYSGDTDKFPIPPFYTVPWAKFGASPDAETSDETIVFDTKILCTPATICFFDDETISVEEKIAFVLDEHGDQIIGLLLARPNCQEFWIVKYNPQIDDNELDLEPTTAEFRGQIFKFKREDFGSAIEETKNRIIFFDLFIDSKYTPRMIKEASFTTNSEGNYLLSVNE